MAGRTRSELAPDAEAKIDVSDSPLIPTRKDRKELERELVRYSRWKDMIEAAEKLGMDPRTWSDFFTQMVDAHISLAGARTGRSIAQRLSPLMVLELSRLALSAKSEQVRANTLREVAYIGGAKPADRVEYEDVSKMSSKELDSRLGELISDIIGDAFRDCTRSLIERGGGQIVDAEVTGCVTGREGSPLAITDGSPESKAEGSDVDVPPAQGAIGIPRGSEEDTAFGWRKPVGEDDGSSDGVSLARLREPSFPGNKDPKRGPSSDGSGI